MKQAGVGIWIIATDEPLSLATVRWNREKLRKMSIGVPEDKETWRTSLPGREAGMVIFDF